MEIDDLKSVWQEVAAPKKGKEELNLMLKKNSYPILTSIKKQITVEALGFTAFLSCYFTLLDGADKPVAINLMIIAAILLQLFYSYKGYVMQSKFRSNTNLNTDLKIFSIWLKSHRLQVMLARIFFAIGLLTSLTYNINFSANKLFALATILIIFSVQMALLYRIWTKRISRLESVLEEFKSTVI